MQELWLDLYSRVHWQASFRLIGLKQVLANTTICKLVLTVNISYLSFHISNSGFGETITDQEQWRKLCKIIGSTNKKEDGQPHLIVLSRQTQSLKHETTG